MGQLVPFTFDSPGVMGLNLQGSNAILGQEWATRARDLVIDDRGRLALRRGYRRIASNTTTGTIETLFTSVSIAGTRTHYCADSDGKLYQLEAGAWVDRTNTVTPASDGNWKFQDFNGKVVAWHADGREVVQASPGTGFVDISPAGAKAPAAGRDVLASFGRLWVIDNEDLHYCGLLDETDWNSGGAGQIPLAYVWPDGQDVPVALANFNGYLVVFGERSIIVYQNPSDPSGTYTEFNLADQISGVGCINRDTVQKVGSDILFLSQQGLKSLSRVIQEKSMPISDVAPQVRDNMLKEYAASTATDVTSCFSETEGLYILNFAQVAYAVDVRLRMQNGAYRVTDWTAPQCVASDGAGGIIMAHGAVASRYQGVLDGVAYDGTGGSSIEGDFESGWLDFEQAAQGASARLKFLKRVKMFVAGGSGGTLQMKTYVEYSESPHTVGATIPTGTDVAKYGIAQYSIDKYGTEIDIKELSRNSQHGGRVVKVGFKIVDSTTSFAINQITAFAKLGKQSL